MAHGVVANETLLSMVHIGYDNYISRESQTTRNLLWSRASVCLSVCLSARGRMPTLLLGPGCNFRKWWEMPPSCALLGGLAIGARVALLWQHSANAKCQRVHASTRSVPSSIYLTQ